MKASLLVLALAVAPACGKHNEVDVLQHEANAVAQYYAPQINALEARVETIFKRGTTIPASTAGIDAVGARLTEARDIIGQLKGIVVPGADGKSAVEKQAAAAAKDRRVADLRKLVHDSEIALERGTTIVEDDLRSVESWIAYFDRQALALPMTGQGQSGATPEQPAPGQPSAPSGPSPNSPSAPTSGVQRGSGAGSPNAPAGTAPAAAEPARP